MPLNTNLTFPSWCIHVVLLKGLLEHVLFQGNLVTWSVSLSPTTKAGNRHKLDGIHLFVSCTTVLQYKLKQTPHYTTMPAQRVIQKISLF